MRIVSLVPAGTEIVCALGMTPSLVAVTHDCDYPAEILALPRVTHSTIAPGSSARDIDAAVRGAATIGDSTFHLDAAALRDLRPDVVVGQTLCAVCAVTLDALPALRARVVPLEAASLEGMLADVQRVADALDVSQRGERLVETLRGRLDRVGRLTHSAPRPRVACLEWLDPLFCGGHWVPEQVALAGGADIFGTPGERSREIDLAEIERADPDVVVLMPCGFHLDRAQDDAAALLRHARWSALRAARSGRIHAVDGAAYFSRPGPRLVGGVEILAALLHRELGAVTEAPTYTRATN